MKKVIWPVVVVTLWLFLQSCTTSPNSSGNAKENAQPLARETIEKIVQCRSASVEAVNASRRGDSLTVLGILMACKAAKNELEVDVQMGADEPKVLDFRKALSTWIDDLEDSLCGTKSGSVDPLLCPIGRDTLASSYLSFSTANSKFLK